MKRIIYRMISTIKKTLTTPSYALPAFAFLSAAALGIALTSQYGYGLQPCHLCVFQRIPYAVIIVLGLIGIALSRRTPKAGPFFLGLIALGFLADAIIAFYHSGVERHWWKSFLEGCTVPELKGNITDVLAQIQATPMARCDEIPWTDPIIGLSMANYNVIYALILLIAALFSLKSALQK